MTGYEIYDEGYEAGYESAMEDLMEAMEGSEANDLRRNLKNPYFRKGMKDGMHDATKHIKNNGGGAIFLHPDEQHPEINNRSYDRGYYVGRDSARNNYGCTFKSIDGKARIKSKKKANESIFDFDDIDHAYLNDEYDDFDYE